MRKRGKRESEPQSSNRHPHRETHNRNRETTRATREVNPVRPGPLRGHAIRDWDTRTACVSEAARASVQRRHRDRIPVRRQRLLVTECEPASHREGGVYQRDTVRFTSIDECFQSKARLTFRAWARSEAVGQTQQLVFTGLTCREACDSRTIPIETLKDKRPNSCPRPRPESPGVNRPG